jgi:hypothetical protein
MAFFLFSVEQEIVRAAIIPIAARQRIGKTNRALVVSMYIDELYRVAAEQTGLWLHKMKLFI